MKFQLACVGNRLPYGTRTTVYVKSTYVASRREDTTTYLYSIFEIPNLAPTVEEEHTVHSKR